MSRGGPKANKRRANARKRALDALISPQTQEDLKGLKIGPTGPLNEHIARSSNADVRTGQMDSAQAKGRKAEAAKNEIETPIKAETQQDLEGLVEGSGEGNEQGEEQVEEEDAGALMEDVKEEEAGSGAVDVKLEDIKAEETMGLL